MVNKYIVYTALFGKYDKLLEIHNMNKHIDYICFTDNKDLTSRTWNIIYVNDDKDIENLDNAEKNRYIKILSHKYISKEWDLQVLHLQQNVLPRCSLLHPFQSSFQLTLLFQTACQSM